MGARRIDPGRPLPRGRAAPRGAGLRRGRPAASPDRTPGAKHASRRAGHLRRELQERFGEGWFEDPAHGTKFDRLGNYELGPAPRGLDRLATLVQDGVVWVNPNEVTLGPPRGSHDIKPTGPFCST